MSNNGQEPIFSNGDVEIIILKASEGVTDTTRRPVSEAKRKAIEKQFEKEAELRLLMEQMRTKKPDAKPTDIDPT